MFIDSFSCFVGECRQGSDAGSVNGDEVDQGSLALHGSVPQPPSDLLSPTGSCSSLGGVPRCLSPAPSDPFPSGSSLLSNGSHISGSVSSLDSDASGSTVTSTESHPAPQRGNHSYSHHDTPRSRRLEAEARKAEKRSRFRSPERHDREAVLSPERRSVSSSPSAHFRQQELWALARNCEHPFHLFSVAVYPLHKQMSLID